MHDCTVVVQGCYSLRVFDDISADELAERRASITAGALNAARSIASEYLAHSQPRFGLSPERITEVLVRRDSSDPDFDLLAPFEKRWATLVVRLLDPPDLAVQDAVLRGVSWSEIGNALGIARTTAYRNFSTKSGM